MKSCISIRNNKGKEIGVMVFRATNHKRSLLLNQNKGKAIQQNSDVVCSTCGKKHGGRPCYRDTGACFGCGKKGHLIRDYPENKGFIIRKPKEENKDNKQKPRAQGRVFARTHGEAQATSDVVACAIRIHTLFSSAMFDPGSTHSFISVSFAALLGMPVASNGL